MIGALNFKETVASKLGENKQINAFGTRKRDKTKTNKQMIPSKAKRINNEPKKKNGLEPHFENVVKSMIHTKYEATYHLRLRNTKKE